MGKYFGTDGFRGEAGVELTALHAFKIGRYLGYHLHGGADGSTKRRARAVIGKDPRLSSYMLEYAIASGLASSGIDVYLMHVTTTPSVSHITVSESFDLGVMITASHNPFLDNGIKIIDSSGEKMDDTLADKVEEYLDRDEMDSDLPFAKAGEIGRICDHYAGRNSYIGHLISLASHSYKGLKIGLDSANGATFAIARSVFTALGAEVHTIGTEPNGLNVNYRCGSTHPEALCDLVREKELDVGYAFDGDGDRCIAVGKDGHVIDGDGILYVLARKLKRENRLGGAPVIATVMSNGGLISSLKKDGIDSELTRVGDRFVYEKMLESGSPLGGESSGHIILSNCETTGDGIVSAIMLTEEMCEKKSSLTELVADLVYFPQRTESVRVKNKAAALSDETVKAVISDLTAGKMQAERLLVRESGTEPKIRIMAESEHEDRCNFMVDKIVSVLRDRGYIDE